MNRRDFLLLAGVIAMAWNPASAEVKIPRIGFIQTGSQQENHSLLDAFRAGLSALGWTEGNNIVVLDRWAEDRTDQLPAIVKELIGSDVTILVTAGTPATLAARRASTTIPIVLVGVDDPVSLGIVESSGHPGQRHGTISDLVRSDCRTVGAAAAARPWSASPRSHRQGRSRP